MEYKGEKKLEINEIGFCNLILLYKSKEIVIREQVYKNNGSGMYYNHKVMDSLKIKGECQIKEIEVLYSLGFANKTNIGYKKVKQSKEKRNKRIKVNFIIQYF